MEIGPRYETMGERDEEDGKGQAEQEADQRGPPRTRGGHDAALQRVAPDLKDRGGDRGGYP